MISAAAIFVLTLVLVIWQPKGLGIGWSASLGALLALLAGVVHWTDIPVVWGIVWNATATFIAIIIISLLLDAAGFFEWAALHVARWGWKGNCLVCADCAAGRGRFRFVCQRWRRIRSDEHTSELQSLMRISYAVFCLKKK